MSVGNKNGLLLHPNTTDEEIQVLKEQLPSSVKVQKLDEKLNALGNVIACNDFIALCHPEIDTTTEQIIIEVLGVEVYKTTIAGQPLVGSYCQLTNVGGIVHPLCSVAELDSLSALVQVPLCAGTVNRGREMVGTGIVANDEVAFCGNDTTAMELNVIDAIFKLNDKQETFEEEKKGEAKIDQLL